MPYEIWDGHACFTTHVARNHASVFTSTAYMDITCSSLAFCREQRGLKVYGYVIMPDHLHLLTNVISREHLEETLTSFRKFTARRTFELLALERRE